MSIEHKFSNFECHHPFSQNPTSKVFRPIKKPRHSGQVKKSGRYPNGKSHTRIQRGEKVQYSKLPRAVKREKRERKRRRSRALLLPLPPAKRRRNPNPQERQRKIQNRGERPQPFFKFHIIFRAIWFSLGFGGLLVYVLARKVDWAFFNPWL